MDLDAGVKAIEALFGDIVVFYDCVRDNFVYVARANKKLIERYQDDQQMLLFLEIKDIPFIEICNGFIETLSGNMKEEFKAIMLDNQRMKKFYKALSSYHQWEEFKAYQKDKYEQLARIWFEQNDIDYK